MIAAIDHELENLLAPAVVADPYPLYARLRESDPVHWNPLFQAWMITRYDDVHRLLMDPRVLSGWGLSRPVQTKTPEDAAALKRLERFRQDSLAGRDGADHRRQRTLIHKAFTSRMVDQLTDFVQARVDQLIDEAQPRGAIELREDLAFRLPALAIFQLCGIPEELHDQIIHSANLLGIVSGMDDPAPGQLAELLRDAFGIRQKVFDMISEQAENPPDNLIGQLLRAEENGQLLDRDEVCDTVYGLIIGGLETTARMLCTGTLALLRNADQLALLRANPALVNSALDEILRFDTPLLLDFRMPSEEISVRGKTIKPGELMFLGLGAANRDPEQFPDPERFDITRQPNRHLSFGYGPHYCVGAQLARLEGRIVFNTLLRRLPGLRLAETELEWTANFTIRDIKALPLVF